MIAHYDSRQSIPAQVGLERGDDWRARRACDEEDAELFFPVAEKGPWDEARAICQRCPVINECLDYALDNREQHGMWGGKTPEQRQQIIRATKRKARVLVERACGDAIGTPAGAKRHSRAKQKPCESCREAANRDRRDGERRRRDAS